MYTLNACGVDTIREICLLSVFPEKMLKRSRPYVVIERNALDKLSRKHRKQGNIQFWIVGAHFSYKE
jgi:hypothetical protein